MTTSFAITDAKGKDRAYAVRPVPVINFESWAVEVTRQDSEAAYRVSLTHGEWACNCKAFLYSKPGIKSCKHCLAAAEWKAIAEALASVPAPVQPSASEELF